MVGDTDDEINIFTKIVINTSRNSKFTQNLDVIICRASCSTLRVPDR